jgi:hypothetical protein
MKMRWMIVLLQPLNYDTIRIKIGIGFPIKIVNKKGT